MEKPAISEDDTKEKRHDVYKSFTSGAIFGILIALLVLFVKSM
ncbi:MULTISPECIES: hypothetical protein [Massilia]|uniref:Aa3-type cytochrome c oxidase subunit IV n=1 Tax=Massilia haematophila TaxID=457923 RepID=A0ABV7PL36_9BURK|nr:hypothetical protein [Massilia sp.]